VAHVFKDRYVVVGPVTLAFFVSFVAAAFAVFGNTHSTSGVGHGVSNVLAGHLRAASLDLAAREPVLHVRDASLLLRWGVPGSVRER
jgi:hypothetical protein